MNSRKEVPRPTHNCPVCGLPQTKIQRVLGEGKYGSISYVCTHVECTVGLELSKIQTWAAL
jgi:hypothetical protein